MDFLIATKMPFFISDNHLFFFLHLKNLNSESHQPIPLKLKNMEHFSMVSESIGLKMYQIDKLIVNNQ
jgi:hypothetical protein